MVSGEVRPLLLPRRKPKHVVDKQLLNHETKISRACMTPRFVRLRAGKQRAASRRERTGSVRWAHRKHWAGR